MAVPSLPAQGSPTWFSWAQGLHSEVTTGRLSDTTLRAAFVPVAAFGNRMVFLGDSITSALGGAGPLFRPDDDWCTWSTLLSNSRVLYAANAGVSGDTVEQMRARLQADVLAYNPATVFILAGTNNALQGQSLAGYAAAMRSLVADIRAAGVGVFLGTVPPNSATGATRQRISAYNVWLRNFAASQRIPIVDFHAVLVDPATGGYRSGYSTDGTHLTNVGAKAAGQAAATAFADFFAPWTPPLPTFQTADSPNLLANGLFLTDTDADGAADNWTKTGAAVASRITGDTAILGNWQKLADAACTTQSYLAYDQFNSGFAVGDRLAVVCRVAVTGSAAAGGSSLQLNISGVGSAYALRLFALDVPASIYYYEFTVPTGATAFTPLILKAAGSGGSGSIQVAQLGLLNLTAMGVLAA